MANTICGHAKWYERKEADADRIKPHGYDNLYGYKAKLGALMRLNLSKAKNQRKVVAKKTMEDRAQNIVHAFNALWELGYQLADSFNLKEKHVQALVTHWETTNKSAATIQTYLYSLRTLGDWIGKPTMVKGAKEYLSDPEAGKRITSAVTSKAWSTNEVDVSHKLREIYELDPRVGMQVIMQHTFGLRRREAIMLKPHRADKGVYLAVTDGTKGERSRTVPIDTVEKRKALDDAQAFVGPNIDAYLGDPTKTLKANLQHYHYILRKCGVTKDDEGITGHGLRHEYLNDRYEEVTGVASPVNGGEISAASTFLEQKARAIVSEEAGHSRLSISTAYTGSHRNLKRHREKLAAAIRSDQLAPGEAEEEGGAVKTFFGSEIKGGEVPEPPRMSASRRKLRTPQKRPLIA